MELESAIKTVEMDGRQLANLDTKYRRDHEVCMTAVGQNGASVEFVSRPTPEMMQMAVRQDGRLLRFSPIYLGAGETEGVVNAAVHQNGSALEYVPSPDYLTDELVTTAVQRGLSLGTLKRISREYPEAGLERHFDDDALVEAALRRNGKQVEYATPRLKKKYARLATQNGAALVTLNMGDWWNPSLAREFIQNTPNREDICSHLLDEVRLWTWVGDESIVGALRERGLLICTCGCLFDSPIMENHLASKRHNKLVARLEGHAAATPPPPTQTPACAEASSD